jgi:hypothetical protein
MKAARFRAHKNPSAFDCAASGLREALVQRFSRSAFMDVAENVKLIGGPRTQKYDDATALAQIIVQFALPVNLANIIPRLL